MLRPQHTAKGEAAQQHRSLTNYKKGKTTQPGPLRTTLPPQSPGDRRGTKTRTIAI
jgi:hypothetical protein